MDELAISHGGEARPTCSCLVEYVAPTLAVFCSEQVTEGDLSAGPRMYAGNGHLLTRSSFGFTRILSVLLRDVAKNMPGKPHVRPLGVEVSRDGEFFIVGVRSSVLRSALLTNCVDRRFRTSGGLISHRLLQ